MRKKKICVLLLCIVLCVALLAGCSDDSIVGTWKGEPSWGKTEWVFHENGTLDVKRKDGEDEIGQRVYEQRENEIWIFKINEDGKKNDESYIYFQKEGKKLYSESELEFVKK